MTLPRTPTCCELACYEDPGCSCEGCDYRTPTTAAGRAFVALYEPKDRGVQADWVVSIEAEARAALDVERLAHKAAGIGFTCGALGRDYEYVLKTVNDMLRAALEKPTS